MDTCLKRYDRDNALEEWRNRIHKTEPQGKKNVKSLIVTSVTQIT